MRPCAALRYGSKGGESSALRSAMTLHHLPQPCRPLGLATTDMSGEEEVGVIMTKRIGRIGRIGLVVGALGTAVVFWPRGADAHERPFVRDANQYPLDFSLLVSWPVLAAMVVSVVAVLAAREFEKRFGTRIWDLVQQLRRGPVLTVVAVSVA